jgi:DNA repair exonuclease SbcCD ATPase subunit
MAKETFEQFQRKLHCSQTTFDELAAIVWEDDIKEQELKQRIEELEKENNKLKKKLYPQLDKAMTLVPMEEIHRKNKALAQYADRRNWQQGLPGGVTLQWCGRGMGPDLAQEALNDPQANKN